MFNLIYVIGIISSMLLTYIWCLVFFEEFDFFNYSKNKNVPSNNIKDYLVISIFFWWFFPVFWGFQIFKKQLDKIFK